MSSEEKDITWEEFEERMNKIFMEIEGLIQETNVSKKGE
jgi:hypothetical protein